MNKTIVLASDHAGFDLKESLRGYFEAKGYRIKDLGPTNGDHSISYAKQGQVLAKEIQKHISSDDEIGIGICGTGLGISFAVNRFKGIRGARITSIADAKLAKKHNNANILIFGGRITSTKKAVDMFNAFLREDFEGGRHNERIKQLDE